MRLICDSAAVRDAGHKMSDSSARMNKPVASRRPVPAARAVAFALARIEPAQPIFQPERLPSRAPDEDEGRARLRRSIFPRFGTGIGDNLKEFFHSGPRGNVRSALLVDWHEEPSLWANLRDWIAPRKLPPLKTTSQPIPVPEIWSKNEQFQPSAGGVHSGSRGRNRANRAFATADLRNTSRRR